MSARRSLLRRQCTVDNTACVWLIRVSSTRKGRVTVSENPAAGITHHRSPFEGHKPGARPTADGQLGVQLRAETLPGLMLITTWTGGVAALQCALANMLGVAQVPDRTGLVATVPAGLLMCTGPQEYQLLMSAPSPGFARPPEGVQENLGRPGVFG